MRRVAKQVRDVIVVSQRTSNQRLKCLRSAVFIIRKYQSLKAMLSYPQHRHQTTTIDTAVLDSLIPKKIKQKSECYATLLEVANNMMSNRKASVRNFDAARLSILGGPTGHYSGQIT